MNLKALLLFLLSLLLLATVIIIDRNSFSSMKEYTAQVDQTRLVITQFERLSNHLKSAQVYSSSFASIASRNYYQLYKSESDSVQSDLRFLEQLVGQDPIQRQRLDTISRLVNRHWEVLLQKNIAEIIGSGEGGRLNDLFVIHHLINQAIVYETTLLQKRKDELDQSATLTGNTSLIFTILALSILLAAFATNLVLAHRRQWLEGFLESILNTSRNGIVNLQAVRERDRVADFRIGFANTAAEELLKIEPAAALGRRLSELPEFAGETELLDRFTGFLDSPTGQSEPFELLYRKGGHPVWLNVVLARLDGGLTATFHDITPLKRSQHELQSKVRQLHRSNKNLQEFAYVASHDLQEPLRKIQTFSDVLQKQYASELSAPAADLLQRMRASSQRMSALIQDLLLYSRLSDEQAFQTVCLPNVVEEVLSDLDLLVQEKKAVLRIDTLPTLAGDPLQLRQLFYNLLSNALKFLRPDVPGEIAIRCRRRPAGELTPLFATDGFAWFYEIAVVDNGIGFEEQYRERIFQLFQRLHAKNLYSGTGIGLAICKKVVENHHGYITAQGESGRGATFTVYLPGDTSGR